ncbi:MULTISPECIES: VCBS repeat-containing protein [Bacillales]|jgi:hypothetical protein|uniref:VCBS repeat-containing protein n=1 Tax=Brevibacillus aydinogluensis TaxID=927786 RepID=A0AA48RJ94_9BACL|nr:MULTISPECIES: VCBS repeat-containing protein [Bacillales]REK65515.1 MAG: hypothetical protein DF221_05450 [Brevibacillus sp.]MBR8660776.1 VCBS repeat-containing protein [Brevibacillus sp. NL20B1]NNV03195.1 VCBS repeat-containing protein [Brevibacillus sp. MCWH]UFJ62512.1 VCBS repeat-containing protein [Anoxybacillus sediminis]CAJ1004376.1 VCBS repeat-containing protein [Brevibacillus aydinogluensis]
MKKSWLLPTALAVFTSACGLNDTPNALMRAPLADANQQSINQTVMQFLPPGSQLTVPLHPEEASAVNLQDLTGDGNPDLIAFYKTEKTDYEIGVLVLSQKEGKWKKTASLTGIGSELDYVQFVDVTGDNVPEMLIGWGGGEGLNKELSIYSWQQEQMRELLKQSYAAMAVGDLTGDKKAELALISHDHDKLTSKAEVYGIKDGQLDKLAELPLEGGVNGYEQATIGKATPTQSAIFVDAGIGAHSGMTELLVWQDGKLVRPLTKADGDISMTFKPYVLPSEDINNDGIVEIGIHTQPPGTDDLAMVEIPWIASYYQWDGAAGLRHVEDHYQSYGIGTDFLIPARWKDKYTIEVDRDSANPPVRLLYYGQGGKEKATLLTLQAVPQKDWTKVEASLKEKQTPYIVLTEQGQQVVVAIQPQEASGLSGAALREYNAMLLTADEIRQLFRPLKMPM